MMGAGRPPLEKTSMTIENVAAPLAQALALKGYETLTTVQQAMLAEGVAGRDLLVSPVCRRFLRRISKIAQSLMRKQRLRLR